MKPPRPAAAAAVPVSDAPSVWQRVCELGAKSAAMSALLQSLSLKQIDANRATILASDPGHERTARLKSTAIQELFREATGTLLRIEVALADSTTARAGSKPVDAAAQERARKDPLVRRALELFDARLIDVQEEADDDV